MPQIYNLTNIISAPDLGTLAQGMTTILNGYYYGYFILLSVAFVIFIYLKSRGYLTRSCIMAAAWMDLILAMFLRPIQLIPNWALWTCVMFALTTLFVMALMYDD